MTPLRRQMIEGMELRGYAPSTIEGYVHAVAQLAGHYHRSPERLSEPEVRRYLLYLKGEKQVARGTFSVALGACGSSTISSSVVGGRACTWPSLAARRSSPSS